MTEHQEKGRRQDERGEHDDVRRREADPERFLHEEGGKELTCVPDDRLARGRAEEGEQDQLPVRPARQSFTERGARGAAGGFEAGEQGRLLQTPPDNQRHRNQGDGKEEWYPPSPRLECRVTQDIIR